MVKAFEPVSFTADRIVLRSYQPATILSLSVKFKIQIQLMCFTFKKSNKQTKKPVNRFWQDDASAGIRSLQTSIEIKVCQFVVFVLFSNSI